MNLRVFLLSLVVGLMLAEGRLSARNTRWLREHGAIEPPGDVWVALAVLYPLAFLLMGGEGLWRQALVEADLAVAPALAGPSWLASGLLLFAAAKGLKYWAIRTLGRRWTFRVMILPGWPLVRSGPYRCVAHPNYVGVAGELVGAAMMFGASATGPVMVVLFGVVLWQRVRFETRALSGGEVGS